MVVDRWFLPYTSVVHFVRQPEGGQVQNTVAVVPPGSLCRKCACRDNEPDRQLGWVVAVPCIHKPGVFPGNRRRDGRRDAVDWHCRRLSCVLRQVGVAPWETRPAVLFVSNKYSR